MEYKLFTFPNCERCHAVKDYLKSINVVYSEHNLGMRDGKKEFGKVLMGPFGTQLKKDEHGIVMPILARMNDSGIEAIAQEMDDVKALFK